MTTWLVVPCFNEASRWDRGFWTRLLSVPALTVVFVDDGSTDETLRLAEQTVGSGPSTVLSLHRNAGKAEAVRNGLLFALTHATADDIVGFLDADGAFDPDEVASLVTTFSQASPGSAESLWSSRVALAGRDIQRSERRHYVGRIVTTIVALGENFIPYDTQCGFKLFRPSALLQSCLETPFETRWLFELELLCRWRSIASRPMSIREEPLHHWRDVPGSKITFREALRIVGELLVLKRLQRRTRRNRPQRDSPTRRGASS